MIMRFVRTFLPGILVGVYDFAIVGLYKYMVMPHFAPDDVPTELGVATMVIAIVGSFLILTHVHFVKTPPKDKGGIDDNTD